MTLHLRQIDTRTPYIENIKPSYYYDIRGAYLNIYINKDDINCLNKEEILDSAYRKGKNYFDKVERRGDYVRLKTRINTNWLGRRRIKDLDQAQDTAEELLKNLIDDLFGIGCVTPKE